MFTKSNRKAPRGFTLIEILVVIGIIAILAAIVIIAINPAKQFAQARNSQRTSNVNAILNAVGQRIADNKGVFEGTFDIGGTTYTCGKLPTASSTVSSAMALNATAETGSLGCITPTYMPAIPVDPSHTGGGTLTDYEVITNNIGRVTICAPKAALENAVPDADAICVQR